MLNEVTEEELELAINNTIGKERIRKYYAAQVKYHLGNAINEMSTGKTNKANMSLALAKDNFDKLNKNI